MGLLMDSYFCNNVKAKQISLPRWVESRQSSTHLNIQWYQLWMVVGGDLSASEFHCLYACYIFACW